MAVQKEFILMFASGQEYLITAKKLRWAYQHGLIHEKYRKDVERELSCAQFERIHDNPDNGYYSFFYNGVLLKQISIDRSSRHPWLIVLKINDRFPGYEPGHPVYQKLHFIVKVTRPEIEIARIQKANTPVTDEQDPGDLPGSDVSQSKSSLTASDTDPSRPERSAVCVDTQDTQRLPAQRLLAEQSQIARLGKQISRDTQAMIAGQHQRAGEFQEPSNADA